MFGNSKPFGTASTFGSSSFGTTPTAFGQTTTAFGAKPATSNVFGASAFGTTAPSTSGLFGANPPSAGAGLFGQQPTVFGQPAATSNAPFGFGGTSTSGGLFGNATPSTQSSGLFGNVNASPFGAPRQAFGGFGTTNTTTGLFGQSTNTGTGLFGQTGGFTATAASGTTVKFNPPTGTDTMMKGGISTNISTRHQCITCMKEYENKSLEELRVEDYAANRKGPQAGAMGGFGTPAPQTGLFGAPAAASTSGFSFGTTQPKSMFGTAGTTNTFGATNNNLFGQNPQAQNTGLFGKNVGFGAPTTSASAFSFGNNTGTSLFGQNTQQKTLFGQTTGTTGMFGAPAAPQAAAFGTPNTGFGAFGATNQQNTGGLFGAKPTGFGATNTTTTNTFSFGNANNMTGGGLFGAKPAAPAFGTTGFGTQSTGFNFGTTPTASTGLFGQTKPAATAFGATGNTFGTGLGAGFGTSSFAVGLGGNTGTGLFGNANANKAPGFNFGNTGSTGFGFGAANPSTSTFNFGPSASFNAGGFDPNNIQMLQQTQKQILSMTINPFGDSPLFRNALKASARQEEVLKPTNPSAQKALLSNNHYKVSPVPAAKVKPKPLTPLPNGKVSLFDGLEDEEPSLGNASFVLKRSIKKLVLKHNSNSSSSFTLTSNVTASSSHPTQINLSISLQKSPRGADTQKPASPLTIDIASPQNRSIESGSSSNDISRSSDIFINPPKQVSLELNESNRLEDTITALHTKVPTPLGKTFAVNCDSFEEASEVSVNETSVSTELDVSRSGSATDPTRIILKRPGYYTVPPLHELIELMDSDGDCFVKDFTVGREGYGKVTFPGTFNVAGLDLDEIVHFRKKEIVVYPDDMNKPPVGEGLNRMAEVTLEGVWPIDKMTHSPIKDPERLSKMGYFDKIKRSTAGLGATLIHYKPETGSWVFLVNHFSKYGLEDSDEEMEETQETVPKQISVAAPPKTVQKVNGVLNSTITLEKLKNTPLPLQDEEVQMEGVTTDIYKDQNCSILNSDFLEDFYSPTLPLMSAVDAGRIQGMKASFFCDDEVEETWGGLVNNEARKQRACFTWTNEPAFEQPMVLHETSEFLLPDTTKKQRQLFSTKDYNLNNSISSPIRHAEIGIQNSLSTLSITAQNENLSSYPVLKSTSPPKSALQLPQKQLTIANKIYLKPFMNSVLHSKQHLISDAGYFMGRSFRVGWGPGWLHSQLQSADVSQSQDRFSETGLSKFPANKSQTNSSFCVAVLKVNNESNLKANNIVQKNLVQTLELQLENSASTIENGSPIFIPKPGIEPLHAMAKQFEQLFLDTDSLCTEVDFAKHSHYVWDLLVSLWGNVPDLGENTDYEQQMARREALSKWLIKTTKERVSNEINNNKDELNSYLSSIFHLMNGRRIEDAVKLAQRFGDYRLSLLLAQSEGSSVIRKLICKQLLNWEESGACQFISENRLILYCLLAGLLVWQNYSESVNCCQNLDWKRALALHLWYQCLPNSSIQEAVNEYDKSFKGTGPNGKCCVPPFATYIENMLDDLDEETEDKVEDYTYDTCYHVLKLYCDKSYRMNQLLIPETYTSDHLDYRLGWLLHLALTSIGYNVPKSIAHQLHLDFASQLESMDMWQWSAFVLLHIPDEEWRTKQVKDLLLKYVSLEQNYENEEKETFLKEQLLIPDKWIFEAKAVKAHCMGKHAEEAWYLLKAGSYSKSHSIVVTHLASDSIINEEYEFLLRYLLELSVPERCSTIMDWANGGQVYLDYINVSKAIKSVLKQEVSAYDLEKIKPEVISLCYRLSSIPAPTLKDRLSQSEMAKKTATILRSIFTLQAGRTGDSADIHTLALHIKQLPMPHDYVIEENRLISHSFLEKVTTAV